MKKQYIENINKIKNKNKYKEEIKQQKQASKLT
jgi:hypothetical protein